MKQLRHVPLLGVVVLALSACTFVKPVPGAMSVTVVKPEHVSTCQQLGQTNTRTAAKVAFIRRKADDVRKELEMLARNDAVALGGDTVVAQGLPSATGTQRFTIYRCR